MRACVRSHQNGSMEAMRSLDDSNFGVISRGSGMFAADGWSFTHAGYTLEPAMQLPVGTRHCFCRGFVSVSSEAQQLLRSTGLHRYIPPFRHTPWGQGLLSRQLDRTAIMSMRLRRTVRSTWRALMTFFTAKVPSSHSPQGCLTWAWPAHLIDSLSALETGSRQ